MGEIKLGSKFFKQFDSAVERVRDRVARFTITTGSVDRENDIIEPGGIDFAPYLPNPVVLWAHDHRTPAIARTTRLDRVGDGIVAECEFPPPGVHPLADQIFALVSAKFIKGASVGFRPLEWSYDETRGGVNFIKTEMLEWSICNVPCNPDTLAAFDARHIDSSWVRRHAEQVLHRFNGTQQHPIDGIDTLVPSVVAHAREDLARSLTHRHDPDEVVLTLEDSPDDTFEVAPEDLQALPIALAASLRDVLGSVIARETKKVINAARGRIDDD